MKPNVFSTIHVVHPYQGETRQIECIGASVEAACEVAEVMGLAPHDTDWSRTETGAEWFDDFGNHIIVTEG